MFDEILQRIREKITSLQYVMTLHAEEENYGFRKWHKDYMTNLNFENVKYKLNSKYKAII